MEACKPSQPLHSSWCRDREPDPANAVPRTAMKKRTITSEMPSSDAQPAWLPLDQLAEAEISSEDPKYPIENALVPGRLQGWRAATPGEQIIRLTFEQPRAVKEERVVIEANECERTQQLVLRA